MTRDLKRESEWRGHVSAQGSSGVSVRAYCRSEGLAESAFHYWKRELKRRDGEAGSAGPRFAEVTVKGAAGWTKRSAAADGAGRSPEGAVEVVLGEGRRIRVGPGFDEGTLRRVVAVLEATGC